MEEEGNGQFLVGQGWQCLFQKCPVAQHYFVFSSDYVHCISWIHKPQYFTRVCLSKSYFSILCICLPCVKHKTKHKQQKTRIFSKLWVLGSPSRCDRWVSDSSSRGVFSVVDKIKSGLKVISARPNWLNGVRSFMRQRCHHASGGDCVHCN